MQVAFTQKLIEFAGALGAGYVGSEATLSSDTYDQGSVVVTKKLMDKYKDQQSRISDANKQGVCPRFRTGGSLTTCNKRCRVSILLSFYCTAVCRSLACAVVVSSDQEG